MQVHQVCECCETRPATHIEPAGHSWSEYVSCDECNPGSPDLLRENGWRDEAWAEVTP